MSQWCCRCIPIVSGAAILGVIGLIFCALELSALIPYLLDYPSVKKVLSDIEFVKLLMRDFQLNPKSAYDIVRTLKAYVPKFLTGSTVAYGVVHGFISLLLVIGIASKVRGLILPYLIVNFVYLVMNIFGGIGDCIGLFYYSFYIGILGSGIIFGITIPSIYFWNVVKRAYVELNNCETENCYCRIDLCPPTFSYNNHVERSDGSGNSRTVELGGARDNARTVESGVQCEQPPPAYSTLHFPIDEMSRQMDEGFRRMDENLDEMSRQMDEKDNQLDKQMSEQSGQMQETANQMSTERYQRF